MAEYRTTLIRNGLIAIIISSLIIGVAFYGSGQIANNISSNNNYSSTQTFPASNSIGYSSTTSGSSATSSTQETTTGTITSSTSAATCCSTSTSTAPGTTPPQGTSSSTSSSSTTTSSSYIATNSYSTFDSTLGVVPLLSIGTGAGCCVYSTYDSPNSTVYATEGASGSLWLFGNGSLVGSLSTDNYSLSAIKGISSNSANGHVYVLNEAPGGNSCCSAWITEVSGQKFVGPPVHAWGVTSNVLADPQKGYVYFGTGGGGACTSNPNGIQVVNSANLSQDVQFIPVGIQPPITTTTTNSTVCYPHSQFTPQRLVLDSSNGNVYVATSAPNSSTVFLVASGLGLLPENLSVPGQNIDALFNPSNGYIYSEQLVNQTTDSNGNAIGGYYFVSVIDTATNSVINGTMIPSEAQLVYDSLNHDVYAFGQKQITVLSGTTISGTYQEPTNATILSVVYDASNNEFVSFNAGSSQGNSTSSTTTNSTSTATSTSSMMIVPPQNTIATIAGALGRSVAYDPSNHAIYTVDANFSGIEEINASTNSFVSNIRFACGNPFDVAFDPQNNMLYSLYSSDPSNCADKNVTLVGINPVSNSIVYHSSAHAFSNSMVYDSKDNTLFIEGRNSTQAQVMWVINASSGAVVKQLGAPVQFYMSFIWGPMLYDPVNDLLYFEWSTPGANNNYYEGSILNASSYSLVGAFNPFSGDMPPSAMTYNTSNGLVYVAEEGSGGCMGYNSCSFSGGKNVTVINGTSVSGEIPVSSSANSTFSSIAYVQGSIYVVNGTTTSTTESLTWVNSSVIGSEELTFPASALYSDPANPSWLYVFGPNSVYVIKVK